jgi:hypothetical protein
MSRATPSLRDFSHRLVAFEARANKASGTKAPPAFQVCEKLQPHLATLMGATGFQALLSRALVIARTEDAGLHPVQVKVDGSLGWKDEGRTTADPEVAAESAVVLVAHLLGLLAVFIGEALTLQMVADVWPKLPLAAVDFGKRDKK